MVYLRLSSFSFACRMEEKWKSLQCHCFLFTWNWCQWSHDAVEMIENKNRRSLWCICLFFYLSLKTHSIFSAWNWSRFLSNQWLIINKDKSCIYKWKKRRKKPYVNVCGAPAILFFSFLKWVRKDDHNVFNLNSFEMPIIAWTVSIKSI